MKRRSQNAAGNSAVGPEGRLGQILQTAAELFDRSGYSNVSMEDIAEAVGLAKPTLYHYVKSKDEILYLIHRDFMSVTFRAMETRARTSLSAESQVRETMVDIIGLMDTHRPLVRVFFEHFRDLPARHSRAIVDQRDRYAQWLVSVIRRGVKDGEFRKIDPALTALGIFGMCNWAYQWYDPKGRLSAREIGGTFADIVIGGIQKPRTASGRVSRAGSR